MSTPNNEDVNEFLSQLYNQGIDTLRTWLFMKFGEQQVRTAVDEDSHDD